MATAPGALMRTAVKARLLELLGDDKRATENYKRHAQVVRVLIAQACDMFVKPTRRKAIIDKIALDVMRELSKADPLSKYRC